MTRFADLPRRRLAVHVHDLIAAVESFPVLTRRSMMMHFEAGEGFPDPVSIGTESEGLRDLAYPFTWHSDDETMLSVLNVLRRGLPSLRAYVTHDAASAEHVTWALFKIPTL